MDESNTFSEDAIREIDSERPFFPTTEEITRFEATTGKPFDHAGWSSWQMAQREGIRLRSAYHRRAALNARVSHIPLNYDFDPKAPIPKSHVSRSSSENYYREWPTYDAFIDESINWGGYKGGTSVRWIILGRYCPDHPENLVVWGPWVDVKHPWDRQLNRIDIEKIQLTMLLSPIQQKLIDAYLASDKSMAKALNEHMALLLDASNRLSDLETTSRVQFDEMLKMYQEDPNGTHYDVAWLRGYYNRMGLA